MVFLLIDQSTDCKGKQRVENAEQGDPEGRHDPVDNGDTEELDITVNRIDIEDIFQYAELRGIVENRGHIHQQLSENGPKILHVTEEHEERRQNQPHSDIENDQAGDRDEKRQKDGAERDAVDETEKQKYEKRQSEVDQRRYGSGEQEEVFRYVDL